MTTALAEAPANGTLRREKVCEVCGKTFSVGGRKRPPTWQRFCSRSCGARMRMTPRLSKVCRVCGTEFFVKWKRRDAIVCGNKCRGIKNAAMLSDTAFRESISEVCTEAARKRADAQRGTGTKSPYVKRNHKHEHRLVMEAALGRTLRSDEVVHHKDGNTRNNDISNLQLTDHSEHAKIHNFGSKGFRPGKGDPRTSRGEHRPNAKLTVDKVVAIRQRHAAGESLASLAREHGVCQHTVKKAVARLTWECVP